MTHANNEYLDINKSYIDMLSSIYTYGEKEKCRGYNNIELISNCSDISMSFPLITLTHRHIGYKFACAEAAWILMGGNRVEFLKPFSKIIYKFSDDGTYFFGAYGPKIIDQIEYIGRCFKTDIYSRQAVINIWREKPPVSKDIPCTLNLQFIIRKNDEGLFLHTIDNMRSSDAWLGVPYDWFSISMVSAFVAIYLRNYLQLDIKLGNLHMHAGSQHLYEDSFGYDLEKVKNLINNCDNGISDFDPLIDFKYEPINLSEFINPNDLTTHLLNLANSDKSDYVFLKELVDWKENGKNK